MKDVQHASVTDKFTFYPRDVYYQDLARKIAKTKKGERVFLATMAFQPDKPLIENVLHQLYAAAQRGVMVQIMIDAFSFIIKEGVVPGPLLFTSTLPHYMTSTFRSRLLALEKLQICGGQYTIVNRPSRPLMLPFAGRSHIKFAVINNSVYVGGCNLANADQLDIMVGWTDTRIANWLCSFQEDASHNGHIANTLDGNDITLPVDKTTSLLLDAGIPNQSLIFDTALMLIDTAQKYIYITCQYFPNDITIRRLVAASLRGVDVTITYNHPSKHSFPLNILHHGVVWGEKRRRHPRFFAHQLSKKHSYIHAKLLVTDQGTIIGSHNYIRAGVAFGTAEIALFNTQKQFGESALETFNDLLTR